MRIAVIICRILLGALFVFSGLNGFFNFAMPKELPTGLAGEFMHAVFTSHYYWLVAACQLIGGLFLLANRYVALGLVILAAIIANILAYHLAMDLKGIVPGVV